MRSSRSSGLISQGKVQPAMYDEPQQDEIEQPSPQWQSSSSQEEFSDAPAESEWDDPSGEPEAPFVPGYYKALYPFEPEGTAEMALEEDQVVRCLGRGGGPGWVIAIKESKDGTDNPDELKRALVPEGYMEFLRAFEKDDLDLGGQTPRMSSTA